MYTSYSSQKNAFSIGLTIGIGSFQESYTHRKIRESLLGSAGVVGFLGISNRCTLLLANHQAGIYAPDNYLVIIRFCPLPFGGIVLHLITQVNDGLLSTYITIFDPRRVKCRRCIPFLFYALVYPVIASNLVNLDNLSPFSDYVYIHTCSPF